MQRVELQLKAGRVFIGTPRLHATHGVGAKVVCQRVSGRVALARVCFVMQSSTDGEG